VPAEEGSPQRPPTRLAVALAGRPVVCTECGREIFRGFAYVLRGGVRVVGADRHLVHVSFGDQNTLRFRHALLDSCPTAERPWAR
jgi:hypothetical protein